MQSSFQMPRGLRGIYIIHSNGSPEEEKKSHSQWKSVSQTSVRKVEMENPHSDRGSSLHLCVWMDLSVPHFLQILFYLVGDNRTHVSRLSPPQAWLSGHHAVCTHKATLKGV